MACLFYILSASLQIVFFLIQSDYCLLLLIIHSVSKIMNATKILNVFQFSALNVEII